MDTNAPTETSDPAVTSFFETTANQKAKSALSTTITSAQIEIGIDDPDEKATGAQGNSVPTQGFEHRNTQGQEVHTHIDRETSRGCVGLRQDRSPASFAKRMLLRHLLFLSHETQKRKQSRKPKKALPKYHRKAAKNERKIQRAQYNRTCGGMSWEERANCDEDERDERDEKLKFQKCSAGTGLEDNLLRVFYLCECKIKPWRQRFVNQQDWEQLDQELDFSSYPPTIQTALQSLREENSARWRLRFKLARSLLGDHALKISLIRRTAEIVESTSFPSITQPMKCRTAGSKEN
jgi:hypothetical protein